MRTIRSGRLAFALAALAVAVAAVTTCGGGSSDDQGGGKITLRVASQAGGTQPGFDAVAKNFHKAHPNVTVKNEYLPIASLPQTLDTQFQAGNAPDVVYGSSGTGNANSLLPRAKAGQLADLSNRGWAKDVPSSLKQYAYLNDKLYLLPLNLIAVTANYNVDVMKQNGWTPPKTFSELLALCGKAKAKGIAAWTVGGQFPNISGIELAASTVYSAQPDWDAQRAAGKVTFASSPLWKQTLQKWVALKNAGCFPSGVAGMGIPQAISTMASGKGLWYVAPAGFVNSVKAVNPKINMSIFPIPGNTEADTRVSSGWTDSLGVNAKSKNLDWALKYMDFVARADQSRILAGANNGVGLADFHADKTPAALAPVAAQLKDPSKTAPVANTIWPNGDIYDALGKGMTGLLTGQKTVDQVLKDMDAAWDKGAS